MISKTGLAVRAYVRWFDTIILTDNFTSTEQCIDKIDELAIVYDVSSQAIDDMLDIRTDRLWDKSQEIMFSDGNQEYDDKFLTKKGRRAKKAREIQNGKK